MKPTRKHQRASRAAIHAANLAKKRGGGRIAQDAAAITARRLVEDGRSAATAIDEGQKHGLRIEQTALNPAH